MINFKDIMKGVEQLLNDNLSGYVITRNAERNVDPSIASQDKGWIGIYRGSLEYETVRIGNIPYSVMIDIIVEVQVADFQSGAEAENKLQDAELEILTVLNKDKKLNATVEMTNGYSIEYEYNADEQVYFHSALITIHAEKRAGA
jgi:hypothetical protein